MKEALHQMYYPGRSTARIHINANSRPNGKDIQSPCMETFKGYPVST